MLFLFLFFNDIFLNDMLKPPNTGNTFYRPLEHTRLQFLAYKQGKGGCTYVSAVFALPTNMILYNFKGEKVHAR